MPETYVQSVDILLVEDNPGDVRLIRETLKNSKIHNNYNNLKYCGTESADRKTQTWR